MEHERSHIVQHHDDRDHQTEREKVTFLISLITHLQITNLTIRIRNLYKCYKSVVTACLLLTAYCLLPFFPFSLFPSPIPHFSISTSPLPAFQHRSCAEDKNCDQAHKIDHIPRIHYSTAHGEIMIVDPERIDDVVDLSDQLERTDEIKACINEKTKKQGEDEGT